MHNFSMQNSEDKNQKCVKRSKKADYINTIYKVNAFQV